ncbi:MAG: lipocalin-like domain-containing protein [Prevotella pectinovora]
MRKTICGILIAATTILTTMTLASCDIETSSAAGDFNGMWHLTRVDTIATGGVLDLKNEKLFWAFQNKLMQADDKNEKLAKILMRFNQTNTPLTLHTPYVYDRENGDVPLSDPTLLAPYGINKLEENFQVLKLTGSKMVLQSETLKLTLKKF